MAPVRRYRVGALLIVMASHSRDSLLCTDNLTGTGRLIPCPRPAPTRYSSGSFLTAGRTNWSCFNPSRPRTAPGPTGCCRARPHRPRTALRPRRLSPPARMTMTGARRPAPRASLQPSSPDSAPGSPPRPSSRSLGKRSRWLRFVRAMSLRLLACLPPYRPVHVCVSMWVNSSRATNEVSTTQQERIGLTNKPTVHYAGQCKQDLCGTNLKTL